MHNLIKISMPYGMETTMSTTIWMAIKWDEILWAKIVITNRIIGNMRNETIKEQNGVTKAAAGV
jgi:hypothetical protein